ncbi:putative pyridoxal kinase [Blastocladiella emersonii ATCC 22665]|nr:putative pyridoxal kinase [Blastocladiella emersonii ATCC 22665]
MTTSRRVLAIQSHVVHGHVGNMSAVFPLQLLGNEVDAFNTVQVSNHSGYPTIRGTRFDAAHFAGVFEALKANGHDTDYSVILTGYMGLPEGVPTVAAGIKDVKTRSANALYLLDPVLGDNGKLYLPPEMIDHYKTHFLPMADVMTPNQFEAELLSGVTIDSAMSAVTAARALAAMGGAALVFITTLDTPDVAIASTLALLVYDAIADAAWTVRFPRMTAHFTGTGDLFSGLIAGTLAARGAWRPEGRAGAIKVAEGGDAGLDAATTAANAVWVMQRVLHTTHAYAQSQLREGEDSRADVLRKHELRLVQSKRDIERLLDVTPEERAEAAIDVVAV